MKWNDLTMRERSDLMGLFLKAGIGSLSDMRHIYDGTQDTIPMEVDVEGNLVDSIKASTVSTKLSRNQWNNLYKQGKVSLSEIPRQYQSYIEGENSELKKNVTKTIDKFGYTAAKIGAGIGATLLGSSLIPYIPHIATVLANPAAANTTAGALASTAFNSYGLTVGAKNVYNTTKKAINDPSSVTIPEYAFAALDALPFISGIRNISKGIRPVIHGISNIIHNNKPQLHEVIQGSYSTGTPNMQYRIVGKPALEDAKKMGVIRSRTGLHHETQQYLRENYYDVLKNIPDWENKSAEEILDILNSKGVLKNSLLTERLNIRPSTNHGNTVGYFHEQTYPSYKVNLDDIIITTPGTSNRFAPGHGGKKYQNTEFGEFPSATLLTNLDGGPREAFINTASSTYWKFNKNKNKWEEFKFKTPKKTQSILDRLPIRFNIDEPGYYFRNLLQGKGAKEVFETKIIRGNPESPFKIPYFNKDYVPIPHSGDIIIKMPEVNPGWNFKWLGLTPHQTADELYKLKVSDLIEFGKSGNTTQFTPLVETAINNVPLTTGASIWKRKNFLGIPYYLKKYKNGGNLTFC